MGGESRWEGCVSQCGNGFCAVSWQTWQAYGCTPAVNWSWSLDERAFLLLNYTPGAPVPGLPLVPAGPPDLNIERRCHRRTLGPISKYPMSRVAGPNPVPARRKVQRIAGTMSKPCTTAVAAAWHFEIGSSARYMEFFPIFSTTRCSRRRPMIHIATH